MASLSRVVHCLDDFEIDYDVLINEQRPVPGFVLGTVMAMLSVVYLRETGNMNLVTYCLVPGICAGLGLKLVGRMIEIGHRWIPSLMIAMLVYLYISPLKMELDFIVPIAVTVLSLLLSKRPLSLSQERVLAHEKMLRKRRR